MSNQIRKSSFWRLDITGLRALAVIPVLIFHAFPQFCPGGFLGVDIFFVISGYLISGIIFRGLINRNFSYYDFYVKRIRRIIPNLLLVLLFVFVLGYVFLLASEFKVLGKHIYSSAIFFQNFRLLKESGDYFAAASINQPLLHLWSLAIEEQFYIVFPLVASFVCFLGKGSKYTIGIMVGCITIFSFVGCILIKSPSYAFYFPLTRFWEIGVGMCLAYFECYRLINLKAIDLRMRDALSVMGLFLIVFAMGYYKTDIVTPGWYSLLPVVGAGALIAAREDSVVNRTILSWKWVSFIGLISYSLYLWHWPILSYLHIVVSSPTNIQILGALLISLFLSVVIYRFVENPIRTTNAFTAKCIAFVLLLGLVMVFALGQFVWRMNGLSERSFNQHYLVLDNIKKDLSSPREFLYKKIIDGQVVYLTKDSDPEILFIGDSHMDQYLLRIINQSKYSGKVAAFTSWPGCLVPLGEESKNKNCRAMKKSFQKVVSIPSVKTVVWSQKWGMDNYSNLLERASENVNQVIQENPSKEYYVLLDYPWDETGSFDVQKRIKLNRLMLKNITPVDYIVSFPTDKSWKYGNDRIQSYMDKRVKFIHTAEIVCPDGKCDLLNVYRDNDHLRSSYLRDHATWIDVIFKN